MIIGKVGLAALAPTLAKGEKRLGWEVNVTNYSADEFRTEVAEGEHFLRTVLKGSLQFVKSEQRDLDAVDTIYDEVPTTERIIVGVFD